MQVAVVSRSKLKRLRRKQAKAANSNSQFIGPLTRAESLAMTRQITLRPKRVRKARRQKRNGNQGRLGNYLHALLDPENFLGAKVPDLVSAPSGTFQITFDWTVPTTAGDGVGAVLSPSFGTSSTTPNASNGYTLGIFQNSTAGTVYSTTSYQNPASYVAVAALYESLRPVSAVMYAEFIGNTLNDAGQIVMGWVPSQPSTGNQFTLAALTFSQLQMLPFTRTYPLRNGGKILWKPEDNSTLEFVPTGSKNAFWLPSIFFATVGQPASTTMMRIRAVINFEGIPGTDTTTLVNAAPSPIRLEELSQAFSYMSQPYSNLLPFLSGVASAYAVPAGVGLLNTGVNLARVVSGRGAIGSGRLPSGSLPEMGYGF